MREALAVLEGAPVTVRATVVKFGYSSGHKPTVLLGNVIDLAGGVLAEHLWVMVGKRLAAGAPQLGDTVQFTGRVRAHRRRGKRAVADPIDYTLRCPSQCAVVTRAALPAVAAQDPSAPPSNVRKTLATIARLWEEERTPPCLAKVCSKAPAKPWHDTRSTHRRMGQPQRALGLAHCKYRGVLRGVGSMATITKTTTSKGKVRYRVRVVVGHKPDGTPIQRMRTFKKSKDAEAAARQWESDRDRGLGGDLSKMRTGEYLTTGLERAAKRVRPSTLYGYQEQIEAHIMPALGGYLLRELTPARLQTWIDGLRTPGIAHRCRAILHNALQEAVQLNLIASNPASRVSAPPKRVSVATAWTKEEARAFLKTASGHVYHPYWPLAVRLGLRPSELLALRWAAIDLDAGTLTVQEGRATVHDRAFEGGTKSRSGYRTLDVPADIVLLLRAHKVRQNVLRLSSGPSWEDHNLVCCGEAGNYIMHRNLTRAFKRICCLAKVRPIRLYDMRHTAISLMAEAGADMKAISEVAGHANVIITRNVYQHVNRNQRAAALEALSQALDETAVQPDDDATSVTS